MAVDFVGCLSSISPLSFFLKEPHCGWGIIPFSTKPSVSHHKHGDPSVLPATGLAWACAPAFGQMLICKGSLLGGLWEQWLRLLQDAASLSVGRCHGWNEAAFLWPWKVLPWGWQIRKVKRINVKRPYCYYWVVEEPNLELLSFSVLFCVIYKCPRSWLDLCWGLP